MKIRTDFVSNSSSSSFIVAARPSYPFKEMVDDICEDCIAKTDDDYDPEYVEDVDFENHVNLNYNLKNYQLLFLGQIDDGDEFNELHNITVSSKTMEWFLFDFGNGLTSDFKDSFEKIINDVKNRSGYHADSTYSNHMFEITKKTIIVTRKLLELGYKLKFNKWEDLDALEKRIDCGEHIYSIKLS